MTITITHAKVSAIADNPGAVARGEVVPSDWNADHVVTGGIDSVLINVKDFGAVGDGVTDDTAAIQAALSSTTGGGAYIFPPGTYLISDSLALQSNSTVIGDNATIQCVTAGWLLSSLAHYGFFTIIGVTDIRITGLHFYGTKTATQGSDAGETHTPKFIFLNSSSRVWIENNFFEHKDWEGIWPNDLSCSQIFVINNVFSDIGFPSFGGLPAVQLAWHDGIVSSNVFLNCGIAIGADGDGNLIEGNRILGIAGNIGIGVSAELPISNMTIANNVIEFTTAGVGIQVDGGVPNPIYVVGNNIKMGSGGGIFLTGINVTDCYSFVRDNLIQALGTCNLIGISGAGSASGAFHVIDGNTVIFSDNAGGILNLGIQVVPNGHTVSAYVCNNTVFGIPSGTNMPAYDFNAGGAGGTFVNLVLNDNIKSYGFIDNPDGVIIAAANVDNNRAYSYSTTAKITQYADELYSQGNPAPIYTATLPTTVTSSGNQFQYTFDSSGNLYFCYAPNTWAVYVNAAPFDNSASSQSEPIPVIF